MPYPYTLTPDGHTLEPEEVVKPPAETQDESTSTQSPFLDFGNPLPPPSGGDQPSQLSHDDGDRPGSQSIGQASSLVSGKQSGTGSDKSENTSKPQQQSLSQQSASDFPPDIGREHRADDYSQRTILEFLTRPGEERTPIIVKTMSVMKGTSLDDEEQDADLAWNRFVQTVDPYVPIEAEPWYTTRLGPAPSSAVAPFPSSYGNMTFPDLISNLDSGGQSGIDTNDKRVSSETDERWYRSPETELDPYIQHALANTFSSREWNEEWTKPEHLEGFLKGNLAPFLPKEYIDSLPWDTLTDFGKIHMYSYLVQALHDETWHLNSPNSDWNIRLDDAAESAEALLWAVTEVPQVNEAKLVEELVIRTQ